MCDNPFEHYGMSEDIMRPLDRTLATHTGMAVELPALPAFIPSQPPVLERMQRGSHGGALAHWSQSSNHSEPDIVHDGITLTTLSPPNGGNLEIKDVAQAGSVTKLACFYCRGRKIRCGGPIGGEGQPCRYT